MPSNDRNRITDWYVHHGHMTGRLLDANHELYKATRAWLTVPVDVLGDRTMTAARDLRAAVAAHDAVVGRVCE